MSLASSTDRSSLNIREYVRNAMRERWRIPKSIEVRCRIQINSVVPRFAHFDGRLEPSNGHDGIRLSIEGGDPSNHQWQTAIEQGVAQFVAERIEQQRPVGNTTLVVQHVRSHPIVTDEATVARHVKWTLQTYFDKYETVIQDGES